MLTLYYWGKFISWRKNYPPAEELSEAGLGGPKLQKNLAVTLTVAQCQKYTFPYLSTLRDHYISLYITKNTILIRFRPILIH